MNYDLHGISQLSFSRMITEEDGDQNFYHKHYEHLDWPEGSSGPTCGVGCDLGYMTPDQVRANWASIVSNQTIESLVAACGLKGEEAHRYVRAHGNSVTITWDQAIEEFARRELPEWVAHVRASLNNTDKLSG